MTAGLSAAAAAMVCLALVAMQVRRSREAAFEIVGAQARVIAANLTAPLDFEDEQAAGETLAGLAAVPEFAAAQALRLPPAGGAPRVLASFRRSPGEAIPGFDEQWGPWSRWLSVDWPVQREGRAVGRLLLLYDFGPARARLLTQIAASAAIAVLATALSVLAALSLQRRLLRPVRELSIAAEKIAASNDYTVRARRVSDDELGALTDLFNRMIGRVQEVEQLRRGHREALERAVAERTSQVLETQSRLRMSERMASLGTLSAGLGHDIGNLLMPLRAHIGAVRSSVEAAGGLSPELERDFAAITRVAEYLQNLSSGLRLLAQSPESAGPAGDPTDLGPWWSSAEPLLLAVVGSKIALTWEAAPGLPPVRLSRHLLTQAVFNLVQNAAQAMTGDADTHPVGTRIRVWARPGPGPRPEVQIGVEDDGPGMAPEVLARCLEPYFTTKTRRISSGLGLSLVKGIAESVGGSLSCESEAGHGARFTLTLPAASTATHRPRVVLAVAEPRRRAMVAHLLTSLNCQVEAPDPPPALDGGPGIGPDPASGLWVTDAPSGAPTGWGGRVLVLGVGRSSQDSLADGGRVTVVEPGTPLSALRAVLQQVLAGA
jgi:signal transduction histidine kinase